MNALGCFLRQPLPTLRLAGRRLWEEFALEIVLLGGFVLMFVAICFVAERLDRAACLERARMTGERAAYSGLAGCVENPVEPAQ